MLPPLHALIALPPCRPMLRHIAAAMMPDADMPLRRCSPLCQLLPLALMLPDTPKMPL